MKRQIIIFSTLIVAFFLFATEYIVPENTHTIKSVDMDRDGAIDIVVGSSGYGSLPDTLTIMLNDGKGYFSKIQYELDNMHILECVDMNGDSLVDIVTKVIHDYEIVVYLNKTNLVFDDSILIHKTYSNHYEDVRIADMDNDNDLDIVYYLQNSSSYWGVSYNENAFFTDSLYYSTDGVITDLSVGKLNNDTLPDIVMPGYQAELYYNNLDYFEKTLLDSFPCITTFIKDVDNNGFNDIMLFDHQYITGIPCYLKILYNFGNDNYIDGEIQEFESGAYLHEVSDLNNDQYPDLIFSLGSWEVEEDSIHVSFNNRDGTFSDPEGYHIRPPYLYTITTADYDKNGFKDIAISGYFYNDYDATTGLRILFNDGYGGFIDEPSWIEEIGIINNFELYQNYPNPFNNETKIEYILNSMSKIDLSVYNTKGQFVKNLVNEKQGEKKHSVMFEADKLNSGVYYYRLKIDGIVKETKKMLYLR